MILLKNAIQEFHFQNIHLYQMDCMDAMAQMTGKSFSLCITDPPYGSDGIERTGGTWANKTDGGKRIKEWDYKPTEQYFKELFRISENQIIWGGNYFGLPPNRHYLIWKKHIPENFTAGMCEYAWSSFNLNPKIFEHPSNTEFRRFHPTQKPVKLYEWLLTNYAKPGDTIFDSHGGSFSSAIAAYRLGFDFTGIELDADYFNAAVKRFKEQTAQLDAFRQPKPATVTQLTLNPYGDKLCPNCNRHHSEAGSFCCTACEFGI